MFLYVWNMLFLAVWVTGMYTFFSMRDIPGMMAREWRLKLIANVFALVYLSFMCFTLEEFYDQPAGTDFSQFCPSFTFIAFLYPPFMAVPTLLMHYNLEFITRKIKNNLTGFFYRFHWTVNRFDFTLVAAFLLSIIYNIPHLLLFAFQGVAKNPMSPVFCYGDQVYVNAAMSVVMLGVVMYVRSYQLQTFDPYGIGLEVDLFNYAGVPMFPLFHGTFLYEYFYHKPVFGRYFTPFYSHMLFMCVFHVSSIWAPIIQSRRKEQENRDKIPERMSQITLEVVLDDTTFLERKFEIFVEQEGLKAPGILKLYKHLTDFQHNLLLDQQEMREYAKRIFEDYLSHDVNGLVMLSNAKVELIRNRLQEPTIKTTIFEEAFEEIHNDLMELFDKWKKSSQFRDAIAQSDFLNRPIQT